MRTVLHCTVAGLIALMLSVVPSAVTAQDMPMGEFALPFLMTSGLPLEPDRVDLRATAFRTIDSGFSSGDYAFIIQSGLFLPRLGLNLRSFGIINQRFSEITVPFTLIANEQTNSGLAVFAQLDVPTAAVRTDVYRGEFGLSGQLTAADVAQFHGRVSYNVEDEVVSYETAAVLRASDILYPVLELRGSAQENRAADAYLLPALKFRAGDRAAFGVGVQAAITGTRAFDNQTHFTVELWF